MKNSSSRNSSRKVSPSSSASKIPSIDIFGEKSISIPNIDTVCENLLNDSNYKYDIYYSSEDVLSHLQKMTDFIMAQSGNSFDYDLLQRIDEVMDQVSHQGAKFNLNLSQQNEIDQLYSKLDSTKDEIVQMKDRCDKIKAKFNEERQADIERLKDKQKEEIMEFRVKYAKDNIPPKYRKRSSDLITIRAQETKLRYMHKFQEAKALRDEGDRKEQEEIELSQKKWQEEREVAKTALIQKHRKQMRCLLENWDRKWQQLQPIMKAEEQNKLFILNKTEKKISLAKAKSEKEISPQKSLRSGASSRISSSLKSTRSAKA